MNDVLKNELASGVLPCRCFGANVAWLRLAVITHNVLTALKRLALPPELLTARPKRLRFLIFNNPLGLVPNERVSIGADLVLAMFAGNIGMKSMTGRILRRFGFRSVLLANGVITAMLLLACGLLTAQTRKTVIVPVLFVHGLSRSMQGTGITTLAFADIHKRLISSATSFSAVTQQMAMGMGVALGAVAQRVAAWMLNRPAGIPF